MALKSIGMQLAHMQGDISINGGSVEEKGGEDLPMLISEMGKEGEQYYKDSV
jgi:hypothetical protein